MATIQQWAPECWCDPSPGPALVQLFSDLGYDESIDAVIRAYDADASSNLSMMKSALGLTEMTSDINYVWTSVGKMALMLDVGTNMPNDKPQQFCDADFVTYDTELRSWVADVEVMHRQMMEKLAESLKMAADSDAAFLEKQIEEYQAKNICDDGNWANGISAQPISKFKVVTKWVKEHYAEFFQMANKLIFFKSPGAIGPPLLQIKVHRICFFFKGQDGPGSVVVNPELATPEGRLRDDLPDDVYQKKALTIDIFGGKTESLPKGFSGKLTHLRGALYVIPLDPQTTTKFDPYAIDAEKNSYTVYKNSYPATNL